MRLAAVDRRAAAQGLAPGMALAQARAIHPALAVAEADPYADRALLEALADWADRFTPHVALDGTNGLLLDIGGCAHLFGGETALQAALLGPLRGRGLEATAAIAGTAPAARALARFKGDHVVAPGGEAGAVSPLPVAALEAGPDTEAALRRAGLKTVGAVAACARPPLAARFGDVLLARLDGVLGRRDDPLSPRRPPSPFAVERPFPEPIGAAEAVRAALAGLARSLAGLLERHGEGLRRAEASFFRTDGAVRRLVVETGRPERDPATLLRLFDERLSALADPIDPGFGFDLLRLAATATAPFHQAERRFGAQGGDHDDLSALVDRLSARLGRARVRRFLPQDTHIPEAAAVTQPAIAALPSTVPAWTRVGGAGDPPARPLRLFAPPERIEAVAPVPDGPPVRFRWRRVLHTVRRAEGPERIAMEWWRHQQPLPTRDYFRVEDVEGRRFWLFREGLYFRETLSPRWFLHGLFA